MGRVALAAVAVFFIGCASGGSGDPDSGVTIVIPIPTTRPSAGDSCAAYVVGNGYCDTSSSMIQCRAIPDRRFAQVPCRGPNGCLETTDGGVLCNNTSGVLDGDLCGTSQEGNAICSDDAGMALKCTDGGFIGQQCDGGCSNSGGFIYCQ